MIFFKTNPNNHLHFFLIFSPQNYTFSKNKSNFNAPYIFFNSNNTHIPQKIRIFAKLSFNKNYSFLIINS